MWLVIITIVCWILAAISNAIMDNLAFKYKVSIFKNYNPNFWNATISWRNKYKNNNQLEGPAFFGSTTFFVFITDGWHLFQFLYNSFLTIPLVLAFCYIYNLNWLIGIGIFFILKILFGSIFEWFYSKIFRL